MWHPGLAGRSDRACPALGDAHACLHAECLCAINGAPHRPTCIASSLSRQTCKIKALACSAHSMCAWRKIQVSAVPERSLGQHAAGQPALWGTQPGVRGDALITQEGRTALRQRPVSTRPAAWPQATRDRLSRQRAVAVRSPSCHSCSPVTSTDRAAILAQAGAGRGGSRPGQEPAPGLPQPQLLAAV